MRIAMTGSTGFIGTHLKRVLQQKGHQVVSLRRQDLNRGTDHLVEVMSDCNAVINLAGAPINRRWTPAYKKELVSSRIETTQLLVQAMAQIDTRPATFISTSAIGAYDEKGRYTEADPPNASDFLGRLSQEWEAAAREAESLGVRTLIFRFALVLGHDGGLMKQVLMPFRLGLGGPIGDGRQHFSWVHIDDLVHAYLHVLKNKQLSGVYHICAPNPVTNSRFTRALGAVLHRPTFFRVPKLLLKFAYGEGAEVMTQGQFVVSTRLPESGFTFKYPDLDSAIVAIVDKSSGSCSVTGLVNSRTKS